VFKSSQNKILHYFDRQLKLGGRSGLIEEIQFKSKYHPSGWLVVDYGWTVKSQQLKVIVHCFTCTLHLN